MPLSRWTAVALTVLVAGTACAKAATLHPGQTPITAIQPEPSSTNEAPAPEPTPQPSIPHVFVIVMENRSYGQAITGGYTAQLAAQYGAATNYHGVSHPSLPNYLALTSGSTYGIADDAFHALPEGGLGAQLSAAGITWRAYMEGMNNGCFTSRYPYALKHNPFAYYGSKCPEQVVPFSQFSTDMAQTVPHFVWITPDMCHDGHDCSTTAADQWLESTVPAIVSSSAFKDDGVLIITWDEGYDKANTVLTLVIHSDPVIHRSEQPYDHFSLLATVQELLDLPRTTNANPMTDLLAATPPPRQRTLAP
jgi:phospholipase C